MISKLVPWMVFFVFGFYLMGDLFGAKLGMIDDHEIPLFLGTNGVITLAEYPGVLASTEVGEWGNNLRFRPSYYALRILETMLWKDNATLWYFTRYILLVISMWMGWRIMSSYFPKILSYLFVFYILTMPFWPDILTRLGPSEIYGIPALIGFVYGYVFNKPWLLLTSFVVAVGAKENFMFLLPLFIIWIWQMSREQKMTKLLWIGCIVALGFTVWIVSAILVATSKVGVDFYGEAISYRYRVTRFVWDIPKIIMERKMFFSAGILVLMIVNFIKTPKKEGNIYALITLLCVYGVIASQYIFYPNQIPTLMRYDFPVMIMFRVADLIALYYLTNHLFKHWLKKLVTPGIYILLTLIMIAFIVRSQYSLIKVRGANVATNTNSFAGKIELITNKAKAEPEANLMFVSTFWLDFEPVISLARYLTAKGVKNNMILSYTPDPALTDPLGIELQKRFLNSMNGIATEDTSFEHFSPRRELKEPCYSITFGKATPIPSCPLLASF